MAVTGDIEQPQQLNAKMANKLPLRTQPILNSHPHYDRFRGRRSNISHQNKKVTIASRTGGSRMTSWANSFSTLEK
jgi:hypothetical protein